LPGMIRAAAALILVLALSLLVPALGQASRKPTDKEKAQIASLVRLPGVCARVRISTVSRKPKWGSVSWRGGASQCDPLASNGVTIAKKSSGRWHSVTAGSSFDCSSLYNQVPRAVAKDLGIKCF